MQGLSSRENQHAGRQRSDRRPHGMGLYQVVEMEEKESANIQATERMVMP